MTVREACGNYTVEELKEFEQAVALAFNDGQIRAPVHLAGGNEQALIDIFKEVSPSDWVCTQWRSHYHCLLKGVPKGDLMRDILAGKSITLTYPEYRIVSSAIVGGIVPIALGIAATINRMRFKAAQVWCFVGDMTAKAGIFHECYRYAQGHSLPINFVVEDNGLSVCTPTREVWGREVARSLRTYEYTLPWPHSGAGKRVNF